MKKIYIIIICLLFTGLNIHAQKLYIRAGLGMAVSTSAQFVTKSNSTNGFDLKKEGIGTGLPFVAAVGYKLGANVSVELGIDYFQGLNIKSVGGEYDFHGNTVNDATSKIHGSMLSLVPAFVLTIPLEKLQPYARIGVKIGVLSSEMTKIDGSTVENIGENQQTVPVTAKQKDFGGVAFGVQAALGTDLKLSNMLALFGEIQLDGISYSPSKGKMTKIDVNGVDELGQFTSEEKSWDYSKSRTNGDGKQDKFNIPFNNVGLVVGVKIKLGS
jgi:hypothetical protein